MNSIKLNVLVVMGLLLLASGMRASGQQTARRPPEDIVGGASLLLETRPQNPRPRGRSGPGGPSKNIPTAPKPAAEESASKTDELEDALALGNALRDRKPPDFQSAEKAYRLGIKLDPEDPRPYAGLGNILYDQKRYSEASDAYREALRLATPRGGITMRASGPDPVDPG